ncbi:uncharacterized protein ANIA_11677 [Aspergillus nidulans FGSC A4]|uniref:Uncharacterized protein n=1 Tax=Emericella nidulans (strain FGSC A4 / ATCC 38163 / CBS 112.46 / NRRL 194 / M139) TaxID=227321 RepID=C8VNF3_EMENI|nr:hypothetical protein [Aspergillus nidulans FGSC A4]CBF86665.1 TPA: hypothetical protein ANIA_11677 [Aspergillus nidulans FGSC A4]
MSCSERGSVLGVFRKRRTFNYSILYQPDG